MAEISGQDVRIKVTDDNEWRMVTVILKWFTRRELNLPSKS